MIGDVSILRSGANALSAAIPNTNVIIILLGFLSAIIDNVPLVAAAMGMYNNPLDDHLWHFIAFTAGTGGSMLIIGSAAGVAAMGMEKIDFIWYFKKYPGLQRQVILPVVQCFYCWPRRSQSKIKRKAIIKMTFLFL